MSRHKIESYRGMTGVPEVHQSGDPSHVRNKYGQRGGCLVVVIRAAIHNIRRAVIMLASHKSPAIPKIPQNQINNLKLQSNNELTFENVVNWWLVKRIQAPKAWQSPTALIATLDDRESAARYSYSLPKQCPDRSAFECVD